MLDKLFWVQHLSYSANYVFLYDRCMFIICVSGSIHNQRMDLSLWECEFTTEMLLNIQVFLDVLLCHCVCVSQGLKEG